MTDIKHHKKTEYFNRVMEELSDSTKETMGVDISHEGDVYSFRLDQSNKYGISVGETYKIIVLKNGNVLGYVDSIPKTYEELELELIYI